MADLLNESLSNYDLGVPTAQPAPDAFEFAVAASDLKLKDVRGALGQWIDDAGLGHIRADLLLVANELASNASEAAVGGSMIKVEAQLEDQLLLTVSNEGKPFEATPAAMPPEESDRGRGLAIVRAVAKSVAVSVANGSTTVAVSLEV